MPVIQPGSGGRTHGTFVSLFSGAGGMDLGFIQAGFRPTWANDIDPIAVETYNKSIDGHLAHAADLAEAWETLPSKGTVDLVVGGPPCQAFSVAGKMDPGDPRSRHVLDFVRVVEQLQPRAFVMENVKALAVNGRWRLLLDELQRLAINSGFRTRVFLLNASHFGVPQARERMFLIGVRDADVQAVRPDPLSKDRPPAVRAAFDSLPRFGSPGNESLSTARIVPAKTPVMRKSPFAGMLFNGQGRPMDLDRPAPTLPASMGGNRTPIVDQHQYEHGGDCWVVSYHEHLRWGGAPYDEVPERLRRLTVEEAAALQTFPNGMYWAGSQSAQFRQIGNAVPPTLAYHVARSVRDAIGVA